MSSSLPNNIDARSEKTSSDEKLIDDLINRAFQEDVKTGDVTTNAIVDEENRAEAVWITKQKGVIAGLDIAQRVFEKLDSNMEWQVHCSDGKKVQEGEEIVVMEGRCRAILTAERIALNFAQRMSGIATMTNKFVQAVGDLSTQILDTRKTVPGLRVLDKQAVKAGGGTNHRMGLFDLAMIKDNHIVAAGGIDEAIKKVREKSPALRIEVETSTINQVDEALSAGADIIMLDNMSTELMKKAVERVDGKAKTEASGNIAFETVRDVAETGVDYVSVGGLTHSVKAFDISQQLVKIF